MKKKRKKKQGVNFAVVLHVLIGAFCGAYSGAVMAEGDWKTLVCTVVVIFLMILYSLTIHEAGHMIFGLMTGYEFQSFRIFSFMIQKEQGTYHWKRFSLAGTGGQCLMSPPEPVNGAIPYVWYNLGGVMMNLLSVILFGVIYYILSPGILRSGMMFGILINAALAVTNGIPLQLGMVNNDGYNALSLGKDPEALRSFWLQLKVNALSTDGLRLRNMPEEWFRLPGDEEMQNSMIAVEGVLYCNRLIDEHRFREAEDTIRELLEKDTAIVGIHKGLLICDEILCMILRGEEAEKIEAALDKKQKSFMKSMASYPSVLRTEYICELAVRKNSTKAEKILEKFEKMSRLYPVSADIEAERELIELVRGKTE